MALAVAAVITLWVPRVRTSMSQRAAWWALPVGALLGAGAGYVARDMAEAALLAVIAGLTPEDSGGYRDWKGKVVPW